MKDGKAFAPDGDLPDRVLAVSRMQCAHFSRLRPGRDVLDDLVEEAHDCGSGDVAWCDDQTRLDDGGSVRVKLGDRYVLDD